MGNKIEFNWEKYQSGEFDCITRDGRKVEQLHWIEDYFYPICGNIDGMFIKWSINGVYNIRINQSNSDLFLIQKSKAKEDHFADFVEMVILELKGVLMEVSDEEDFENTSQELIIGTLNGLFISNTLESWGYARPIKEVKEAWVNVYQLDNMLCTGSSYKTKEEAINNSSHNIADYIKTIRITNKKDGE